MRILNGMQVPKALFIDCIPRPYVGIILQSPFRDSTPARSTLSLRTLDHLVVIKLDVYNPILGNRLDCHSLEIHR